MRRAMMMAGREAPPTFVNVAWSTASTLYPTACRYSWLGQLQDGRVVNVGGSTSNSQSGVFATVRIGTLTGNDCTWVTSTSLPAVRANHGGVMLPDGRILIIGGGNGAETAQTTVYIGTVSGDSISWVTANPLPAAQKFIVADTLPDGRVVFVGNQGTKLFIGTVSGNTVTWVESTSLPTGYGTDIRPSMYVRKDGKIVTGAAGTPPGNETTYVGTVTGNTTSWVVGEPLACGSLCHTRIARWDYLWAPDSAGNGVDEWVPATPFDAQRYWAACTQLIDGRIMVVGGTDFATNTRNVRFGVVSA